MFGGLFLSWWQQVVGSCWNATLGAAQFNSQQALHQDPRCHSDSLAWFPWQHPHIIPSGGSSPEVQSALCLPWNGDALIGQKVCPCSLHQFNMARGPVSFLTKFVYYACSATYWLQSHTTHSLPQDSRNHPRLELEIALGEGRWVGECSLVLSCTVTGGNVLMMTMTMLMIAHFTPQPVGRTLKQHTDSFVNPMLMRSQSIGVNHGENPLVSTLHVSLLTLWKT